MSVLQINLVDAPSPKVSGHGVFSATTLHEVGLLDFTEVGCFFLAEFVLENGFANVVLPHFFNGVAVILKVGLSESKVGNRCVVVVEVKD